MVCHSAAMALMDLSGDGLRAVLQHLQPKDLCRCKQVCRKLATLASEDILWEAQSLRWFRRHGKQSGLCNVAPSTLRLQLQHASFASLYQALHSLGGWPEGLWYRTDSSGQPQGAFVLILLRGAVLHVLQIDHAGSQTATFCRIALDTLPVQVFIDATPKYHIIVGASAVHINSSAGTMVLDLPRSRLDSDISASLKREGPHNHAVPTQARNFWPYGGPWGSTDQFCSNSPELLRLHRIAPLPSALPNLAAPLMPQLQLGFTAAQALQRVAGLWTASYGGHGPEIVHVWFDETLQSHNGAPMLEGPNARPRLVGCKVTGDPNVPANQWSFVAQAGEMKQGGWDGRGSWTEPEDEDLEYRPIVMFRGLPTLVDMRDRQVLARFLCHGCISHIPGDFRPEWVSAQLLLYEDPKPMFSVLYDDPDDRYRHMMDFQPVPLPCKPFLTWPQHVQSED